MIRITTAAVALAAVGVVAAGGVASAASTVGHGSGAGSGSGAVAVASCDGGAGQVGSGQGWGRGGRGARGHGPGSGAAGHASDIPAAVPGATISSAVATELAFMVQEEKLARDVYALAASLYPDRVFANINRSESTHMAELRVLLDRYDVADPTAGAKVGAFADGELQALYEQLAAQVRTSRDQAVQAGILVETKDIADLKEALAMTAPSDVTTVLGNLLAGSERHLTAFERNAG